MEKRMNIAIYLNECKPPMITRTRPYVRIVFSHGYTRKIEQILRRQGFPKTELARTCLMKSFGTTSIKELKAMIEYSSEQQSKPLNEICKIAIKKAIDEY